ncbi:hypothetical protein GALMADRAFT_139036 [Galerina marginata CBS 339.88]|uniref:Uncharacterized protein n=1 Tax=Galerina marginata (strain CBS 339.88) TaxID=685588 RepID=A0A067TDH0_GALM3|nr:hypothetical protein GALMADRAFT_139036 [Galerina marginata CBS 339.88]
MSPTTSTDPSSSHEPLLDNNGDANSIDDTTVNMSTGAIAEGRITAPESSEPCPQAGLGETETRNLPSRQTTVLTRKSTYDAEKGGNYAKIPQSTDLKYELPNAVVGAVVSGLLAAVAAQLLVFFKDNSNYSGDITQQEGAIRFLLASCYAALFLSISATISSFIPIDVLGEIGFRASCQAKELGEIFDNAGTYTTRQDDLLVAFGASQQWNLMLFHWLATFYLGILALIISVLTYVSMEEPLATKIFMGGIVLFTLFPVSYFILLRPVMGK